MKKFTLLVALITIVGALSFYVTRDTRPTHQALQSARLPPLIPTRSFYASPGVTWGHVLSHDARYVAYFSSSLLGRKVVVKDLENGKKITEFPADIEFVRWHPSEPLLRFIRLGHDWEVNPFEANPENWKKISPVQLSGGWIKNQIATDSGKPVLVWGKPYQQSNGHLYLVSQDGLESERIAEGNDRTQYWITDAERTPVLRLDTFGEGALRVFRSNSGDWGRLIDVSQNDTFHPISHVREDGTVLVRSSRGRDKVALVAFDIRTAEEEVLFENTSTDIGMAISLTPEFQPDILRVGASTSDYLALTKEGEVFLEQIAQLPKPVYIRSTMPSPGGRYTIASLSTNNGPYTDTIFDLEGQSIEAIGTHPINQYKEHFVRTEAVSFASRTGLQIPAIVAMPESTSEPIPFIVRVHGGPSHHVDLEYDPETQFLTNRGYGVLSVNFRGSTGFGKAFQAAGFRQFGRAMQDDIADAAKWLVDEDLADADALAVMGTSYGGYSAALAMTRDPGLFSAAIVEFPLLDLEFQSRHYPGFWNQGIHGWTKYFGDVEDPEDAALMRKYSPSNRVDRLHGPVLMIAGLKDQITSPEQVRAFEEQALLLGKDVRVHYLPNAGHGSRHWRDQLRRARLLEDFLAKELGGRSSGFEFAERAPSFID
ncbi:MAG: alpha/beta fold hydrolase [Pseudomonadota bacterium]